MKIYLQKANKALAKFKKMSILYSGEKLSINETKKMVDNLAPAKKLYDTNILKKTLLKQKFWKNI